MLDSTGRDAAFRPSFLRPGEIPLMGFGIRRLACAAPRFAVCLAAAITLVYAPAWGQTTDRASILSTSTETPAPAPVTVISPVPVSGQEGTIDPKTYVLGPGDELSFEVLGRLSMSQRAVVDPEGNLWIPDFGGVHVAGLTLEQARVQMSHMMRSESRGLDVHLRLVRLRHFKVFVSGEVRGPGVIEVVAGARVSEAVQACGGFADGASKRNIVVASPGGGTRSADLLRFERLGDRDANPVLGDGDQVRVPRKSQSIFIYAPVPYSGEYEFREHDKLGDWIRLAGGLLPGAIPSRATLVRYVTASRTDTVHVDLTGSGADGTDIELQASDRLFVPQSADYQADVHVTVQGEVVRPGMYPLHEGKDRLSTVILNAGGLTPRAAGSSVLVVRAAGSALERDPEFDRLARLSRHEMTDSEYQTFRTKLAAAQSSFLVDVRPFLDGDGERRVEPDSALQRASRDIVLERNDFIRVEREPASVQVSGLVRRPGLIGFEPALRGEDYIARAGGFAHNAKRGAVRVTRNTTGQTLLLHDVSTIEPGDLIYVPDRPEHNYPGLFRDLLVVAGSVATIVIAFRR